MDKYEVFKKQVNDFIHIDLNYYKEKQMKRRITSLLKRNNFNNFDDYFQGLESDKALLDEFVNYLTINVSEFYRNPSQWEVLEKEILPDIINKKNKNIKIWSSACSTGEEPYSMVMLLTKFFDLKDIKILASDIDVGAMDKAKLGIYNSKSLDNLPKEFKVKYFEPIESSYKIKDDIKKCVEFKKMDLLKDVFPRNLDLIICRNVMIYFTEDAKELLYKKFYDSLSNNGVLFVGSTEQIILPDRYKLKSLKTFFYKKDS
ncbi:CheR family methyltransferase [Sporanaerobacter acetigenes]|uniref:protein-glutamate O-methyltransferase n=1 Tax=Sporanaerobacter acetigenes DSM 13106 TaxID=1123281 RepID=A0A1M5XLJ9_9FIRM|nr:protein-glutamate O-methyltransferase CheR [Sporanaerobacter acetigenes]SHI00717.1 chemotaxis protein methyltransferase CheR [Sporanaerobacter acetigenes DSM 13106]